MSHIAVNMNKRKATVLHGQELKCKNGCGFFGNPEWQGYCSKCHRELNQKSKHDTKGSAKKVIRSFSDVQDSSLAIGFSKFEEKKKQHSEKRSKTIKSIIKRGHTSKDTATHSPSRDLFSIGEVSQLFKDLQLKENVSKDVLKQIQKQLDIMSKHYDRSIDEQSEVMQDFYNFMSNRIETHPSYQDMSSELKEELLDKIEELLMIHMHRTVFQIISTEYEDKDLALQKRIRSLNWITSQRLGLDIKESSPEIRELIDKAITDVIEMDSKIAPQEKISCIVNCSKNIFNIINLCQGGAVSADEFLPAMVYIVLKANPPLLQSNIKYITSYSIPTRLRSGEGAYYFTNLCCAVAFIEDLTSESLNLTNEEFERYLGGEVPIDYTEQSATACEGLRLMSQNLATLNEIHERNVQVLNDMYALRDDMTKFEETILKCKPASPLKINQTPYTVPHHVDMGLIPEILRSRVVREEVEEDILIDIQTLSRKNENQENTVSNPTVYGFPENCALAGLDSISLVSESNALSSDLPVSMDSQAAMHPLQVALPAQSDSSESFPSSSNRMTPVLPVVNIKDLEYPTEIFPDAKCDDNSLDVGTFSEGRCGYQSSVLDPSARLVDPLSPETGFLDENLHLPPPLLPVVVQNMSTESESQKL